ERSIGAEVFPRARPVIIGRDLPQVPEMTVVAWYEDLEPPIRRAAHRSRPRQRNPERAIGAEVFPRARPVIIGRSLPQVPEMTVVASYEDLEPPIRRIAHRSRSHHLNREKSIDAEIFPCACPVTVGRDLPQVPEMTVAVW